MLRNIADSGKTEEIKDSARAALKTLAQGKKDSAKAEALIFASDYPEVQNNGDA